jgi:hypothetical protein
MKRNGLIKVKISYENIPILNFETNKEKEFDDAIKTFKKKTR